MNKSILLLVSLVFLCFSSLSQKSVIFNGIYTFTHPLLFNENNEMLKTFQLDKGHGVEEQKDIQFRKSNKIKKTTISNPKSKEDRAFTYNENGRLKGFEQFRKGKRIKSITIDYINDSLFSKVKDVDKKGNSIEYIYTYTDNNHINTCEILINNDLKLKRELTYVGNNKIAKDHKIFYNRKKEKHVITENEYYENGDLKKTTHIKNGKIIRVYEYECKPEGEEVKPTKTNSDVCIWEDERNDGSYTRYVRTQNKKSVYLNVFTFNKDSVLVDYKSFVNEDRKVSHTIYGKHHTTYQYFRKNKLNYSTTTTFGENKRVETIVQTYPNTLFSGKPVVSHYNYTADGLVSSITKNRHRKNQTSVTFNYELF